MGTGRLSSEDGQLLVGGELGEMEVGDDRYDVQ